MLAYKYLAYVNSDGEIIDISNISDIKIKKLKIEFEIKRHTSSGNVEIENNIVKLIDSKLTSNIPHPKNKPIAKPVEKPIRRSPLRVYKTLEEARADSPNKTFYKDKMSGNFIDPSGLPPAYRERYTKNTKDFERIPPKSD